LRMFNLSITDEVGHVLAKVRRFAVKQADRVEAVARPTIRERCFRAVWSAAEKPSHPGNGSIRRLLIVNPCRSQLDQLITDFKIALNGRMVMVAGGGSRFERISSSEFRINFSRQADYDALLQQLKAEHNQIPDAIIHICDFGGPAGFEAGNESVDENIQSVFYLNQALVKQRLTSPVRVFFVDPDPSPHASVWFSGLSGFARSMTIENPHLLYKVIEITRAGPASPASVFHDLTDALTSEIQG
jgi:beta-ketoacyl synthase-like protein